MMTFKEFADEVAKKVAAIFGDGFNVSLTEVRKNNGQIFTGVVIRKDNSNMSPTIYLDGFYQAFERDEKNIEEVVNDLIRIYGKECSVETEPMADFASQITDFNYIRDKIFPRLVNYEANKEMLSEVPHRKILDLALFYAVKVEMSNCEGHVVITNALISNWYSDGSRIEEDDLFEIASQSDLSQPECQNILSVFAANGMPFEMNGPAMYVITKQGNYGAATICNHKFMEILESFGRDLYLIPSSVHEWLVVPDVDITESALRCMVHDVNATVLNPEDRLSDNVYRYSHGEISIA